MLVDLKPTGQGYMEDLYHAGGLSRAARNCAAARPDCLTVTGHTLGEHIAAAPAPFQQDVIRAVRHPIYAGGAMAVLRGNLAPHGAIIKQLGGRPEAVAAQRPRGGVLDRSPISPRGSTIPTLDVKADDVIVLQNAGPKGAPGMPEAGYIPIPKKLLQQGVKDMVRISDARMSGTAFGTIVLHISPEAAVGGPLGLVRNGDRIKLDTAGRTLSLLVDDSELEARRNSMPPPPSGEGRRGYERLYFETVTQAEHGCDFDFAMPKITRTIP